ncbi:MAG: RluA family pseudouridine synthase [Firmicutes bacterium]|nr:RluA family pseudouridine synthase [Bacillota bacterium]
MEDGKKMINVLYEDNHIIVVMKPANVPVCEDSSGDLDLLSMVKHYLEEKYNKNNAFVGLVHRLDRPVGGVMVFAKTSKAASRLSDQIRKGEMKKKYYAVVMGKTLERGIFVDKLEKDSKKNISFVSDNGKESILEYERIKTNGEMSLVSIDLKTGRSHQIRVQFSHHGFPLYGDQKYNKKAKMHTQIALFAYSLSFLHPTLKKELVFSVDIPKIYPYNF